MASLTSRVLLLAAIFGCGALALRPATSLERALDTALSPLRLLSELARPVGLLQARTARAAERRVQALLGDEQAERRELGGEQLRFVLPDDEGLLRGRDFVLGEVVGRAPRDVDRLQVRLLGVDRPAQAGVAPGQPVVVRNHYVGRVHRLTADGVLVDLVTRSDGLVGAALEDGAGSARLVVGGVLPRRRRDEPRLLAVRNPERRPKHPVLEAGAVRVADAISGSPLSALAEGFLLGQLTVVEQRRDERAYGVLSPIDFASGIFQLAVVVPSRSTDGDRRPAPPDPLEDTRWVQARALSSGDPLGTREGVVLDIGSLRGIRPGAAVVAGAHLVGRVGRVGLFSAAAHLLGDPGLALPVVARVEGRGEPLILGWLVSVGRSGARAVQFHWERGWPAVEVAAGDRPVRARLYTGAGAAGVPPWLVIGETLLPRSTGPQRIDVELAVDPRQLAHLRVRLAELRPEGGREGTP